MKTILVTGGAGFMGSNFVKYLLNKYPDYKILILDALTYAGSMDNIPKDPRVQFWYGNVRNSELVNNLVREADVVAHFAAETHVTRSIFDNLIFYETDVLGTQCIANAVLNNKETVERFLHISTSEVYGTARGDFMHEDDVLMPASPYASAKAGADRLVYSYWNTYDIPAVIIRPFNNYGPFQHLEKAIPRFITSCILGEPITIHGDGSSSRDWLFVDDLCTGLDKVMHCDLDKVKGEVFNLGTGESTTIEQIAKMIMKLMGIKAKIVHQGDRPGQVLRHTASPFKAKHRFGWEPNIGIKDGLERTIRWYVHNRDWWERQLWMRSIPIMTKDGKVERH